MSADQKLRAREVAAAVMGWNQSGLRLRPIRAERGVFSVVWRVEAERASVVVKMPRADANGEAARRSGAYERERLAYDELVDAGVPAPTCHGIIDLDAGPAFVLEDLSPHRQVDQEKGLNSAEVDAVIDAIVVCHRRIAADRALALGLRSGAPSWFPAERLEQGIGVIDPVLQGVFARLLAERRRRLREFQGFSTPVCCHGDPRADNLVFTPSGAVLFDWQQMAVQIGEADVAWLLATSTTPDVRRAIERAAVARYADLVGRPPDQAWSRYRAGLLVPGLAVLLLVQRQATGPMARVVASSVERIAAALADHA